MIDPSEACYTVEGENDNNLEAEVITYPLGSKTRTKTTPRQIPDCVIPDYVE